MPIRYRFSLVAGILLLGLAAALVTAAYLEVIRSGRRAAENRLSVAAGQLAQSFSTSARTLLERAESQAREGAIADFLRFGSLERRGTALEALRYTGPQPDIVVSVELWDRLARRLLTTGPAILEEDLGRAAIALAGSESRTSIGELVVRRDSILYPAIVRVEHSGEPIGHVIQWRTLQSTPQALSQFGRLIGDSATLLFGNQRQNVWSDLTGPTVVPRFDAADTGSLMDHVRPGVGRRLGVVMPVADTPWLLILEFPAIQVLGPAATFLARMLVIAGVFVIGGLVAMWIATRTITRPLTDLVTAADAVADGRFDTRIPERGPGELGRLAAAFATMSTRVQSAMQSLEARVARRTAALSASEEQFRTLVTSSPDSVITADADWQITYCNPAAETTFGYAPGEAISVPFERLVRAGQAGKPVAGDGRLQGRAWEGEAIGHRRDGTTFPVEVSTATWQRNGHPEHCMIVRDVTTRKHLADSLRRYATDLRVALEQAGESESKLTQILEALPVGVFVVDASGRSHYANRAAQELLGSSMQRDVMVVDLPKLYGAYRAHTNEPYPPEAQPLAAALEGSRAHATDMEIRRAGTSIQLEVWAAPVLGADRRVSYAVAAFADVSEREAVRAELERLNGELGQRNVELEAVNHELDTFCHSVAHDLRAPLRAIDGFSRILIEDRGAILDEEAHRLLTVIRGSTTMMGQLIDDLLMLSRFSRRPLDTTVVDMNALLDHVVADIHAGRAVSPRIEVAELPPVSADVTLIRQVWFNLVDNAAKFSRNAADPCVSIVGDVIGSEVCFSVRDNGVGFDPAYADKLFGVFQRLHRAEDFEGTGVGLAIVQRVVARHGGRVWAHSEPGSGATFGFSLPLHGTAS